MVPPVQGLTRCHGQAPRPEDPATAGPAVPGGRRSVGHVEPPPVPQRAQTALAGDPVGVLPRVAEAALEGRVRLDRPGAERAVHPALLQEALVREGLFDDPHLAPVGLVPLLGARVGAGGRDHVGERHPARGGQPAEQPTQRPLARHTVGVRPRVPQTVLEVLVVEGVGVPPVLVRAGRVVSAEALPDERLADLPDLRSVRAVAVLQPVDRHPVPGRPGVAGRAGVPARRGHRRAAGRRDDAGQHHLAELPGPGVPRAGRAAVRPLREHPVHPEAGRVPLRADPRRDAVPLVQPHPERDQGGDLGVRPGVGARVVAGRLHTDRAAAVGSAVGAHIGVGTRLGADELPHTAVVPDPEVRLQVGRVPPVLVHPPRRPRRRHTVSYTHL